MAVWESPTGHVTPNRTNITSLLVPFELHNEPEKIQEVFLNVVIVLLLFKTPLPSKDDQRRSLDEYCIPMAENIATLSKANNTGINGHSDRTDRWFAMQGPGVRAIDVNQTYEYLKSHPMERGNPFYRWQQIHRIAQYGEPQCRECWTEKETVERKFFHALGDVALFDDSD